MKKRRILILFAAGVLAAGFFLYGRLCSAREPEFVLSYAENQTEDYPTTLGAKKFAELVERESSGRIKILVQAEGELGAESGVIAQMQYGGIDFARVSLSQLAEYIPELNVLQMPYLYSDSDHMWKVLDGRIGSDFLEKVSKSELIGLSWYDAGARNFYNSKKPITCLEPMQYPCAGIGGDGRYGGGTWRDGTADSLCGCLFRIRARNGGRGGE